LRWQERGGPPVVPPSRKSFGSRLIERSLAAEFGGTVTMDYAPTGVVCTVDASLAAVQEETAAQAAATAT
jgi:two-component sensor histidine kinase